MWRAPGIAAVALTALVAATPAAALPHRTVAHARCDEGTAAASVTAARRERLGPLVFGAGWESYAHWFDMERFRDPRDGTIYAKSGLYVGRGVVATLSIAPAYRGVADFVYGKGRNGGHVLSEVVRIRGCARRRDFMSGGLVVTGPACVLIQVRGRGDSRVYRRMVSIDMGPNCPAT
jgi:hypothetical protein